jgi:hypothetical protein
MAEAHFYTRMAGTSPFLAILHHIMWNISSICVVRYPRRVNDIIKAKLVCRTTFQKKIRIFWVCQSIIKVLKAIL